MKNCVVRRDDVAVLSVLCFILLIGGFNCQDIASRKRWYFWQTKGNTDLDEDVTACFGSGATNRYNIALDIVVPRCSGLCRYFLYAFRGCDKRGGL